VNHSLRPSFIIGCLLVPFAALTVARESVLQGLGKIQLGLLPEYVVLPLTLIALIGLAKITGFLSLRATSALVLNLTACMFTLCIGIAMVRRCLPRELKHVPSRLTSSRWAGGAMSLAAISVLGVASTQLGAILLGSLAHPQDVGIYQVGTRISQVLLFALIAVNMSLAPRAASLHTLGNTVELQRVTTHAVRASIAFSVPLATLLILFRNPLLSIFGGHFGAGSSALIFLVLGQLFNAFMGPVGILLAMTGQERIMVVTMTGCLLLQLALSLILIPTLGVEGAAIGSMVGLISWNAIFAVTVATRLHLNPLPFPLPIVRHSPNA
jgi:O-antigen/teichoic acid export membrane protein